MNDAPNTQTKKKREYPEVSPKGIRSSRMKLLFIIGMFVVPLMLASVYLQMVKYGAGSIGSNSRGELISPAIPLTEFSLLHNAEAFDLDTLHGIWTLLYLPEGPCLDVCQKNLYHMRQVRLSLNQRMTRVQRVFMATPSNPLSDELKADHLGLLVLEGEESQRSILRRQVRAAEEGMESLSDAIYVIDPFGNLMMRFPADLPPKSMLKDLRHLLKVSRIG